MSSIKDRIRRSFSRAAQTYDDAVIIQRKIAAQMAKHLENERFSKILELGCGTGNYTELLLKSNPDAHITAIDFSEEMVQAAKAKLRKFGSRISFAVKDIEDLHIEEYGAGFDLITSNSTFHWLSDFQASVSKCAGMLSKGGKFLISYFGPGTYKELKQVLEDYFGRRIQLSADSFLGKTDFVNIMRRRFHPLSIAEYETVHNYDTFLALLLTIKNSGTAGAGTGLVFNKTALREIEAAFIKRFGSICATYHYYIFSGINKGYAKQ